MTRCTRRSSRSLVASIPLLLLLADRAGALTIEVEAPAPALTRILGTVDFGDFEPFLELYVAFDDEGRLVTGLGTSTVGGVEVTVSGRLRLRRKLWTYALTATGTNEPLTLEIAGEYGGTATVTYSGAAGDLEAKEVNLAFFTRSDRPASDVFLFPEIDADGRITGSASIASVYRAGDPSPATLTGRLRGKSLRFSASAAGRRIRFRGRLEEGSFVGRLRFELPPAKGSMKDVRVPEPAFSEATGLVGDLRSGIAVEPAFRVATFSGDGATALRFGMGGAFGDSLYLVGGSGAVSRRLPNGATEAAFEINGSVETACGTTSHFSRAPFGMLVTNDADFGEFIYTGTFNNPNPCEVVSRLAPDGTATAFTVGTPENGFGSVSGLALSPGGDYGAHIYAATGELKRIDANGVLERFADGVPASGLAFGPGGAFGTELHVAGGTSGAILRVDATGAATVVTDDLRHPRDIAWGPGGPWGDSMYVTDIGFEPNSTRIVRVRPDGTHDVVADNLDITDPAWGQLAFGPASYGLALFVAEGARRGRVVEISIAE